jgi:hypothetical protein
MNEFRETPWHVAIPRVITRQQASVLVDALKTSREFDHERFRIYQFHQTIILFKSEPDDCTWLWLYGIRLISHYCYISNGMLNKMLWILAPILT